MIITKERPGEIPPSIMPLGKLLGGENPAASVSKFAGIVGASQIPDFLCFLDGSQISTGRWSFAHFATEEEYRPQTINLAHSVAVVYPDKAVLVLPPLNKSSQQIEAITVKSGHMSFGVMDSINAPTQVRQAHDDAFELRYRQTWLKQP